MLARIPPAPATSVTLDATRVYTLLLDPLHELQWRPIGMAMDPSPLGAATSSQLAELRAGLAAAIAEQRSTVRPFAALVRTAALLTQWARAVQGAVRRRRRGRASTSCTATS